MIKDKWLNWVLLLTNRIYNKKQLVISRVGLGAIYNVLMLVALEIVLGIISLPLYLGLKSSNVTTFLSEKGTYKKVSFDYNLRRILTLTGVGIVALIWAAKLLLIIALPVVYGPMQLYSISNFSPAEILSRDLISSEIGIQSARVVDIMAHPEFSSVVKVIGGNYDFLGTGQPNLTVVLLLSDTQTVVYSTQADKNGNWRISHKQSAFRLKEGNHAVVVFSYDKELGVRSEAAPVQFFKVTTSWVDLFAKNLDILANWSAIIILLIGLIVTLLTV